MHSWGGRYEHFARPHLAAYEITKLSKMRKNSGLDPKAASEEMSLKSCPLGHQYDPDLHYIISLLLVLDGRQFLLSEFLPSAEKMNVDLRENLL